MTYDCIRRAAFVPDPAAGPFQASYYTLAFPRPWREAILELYRHGKPNPEKIKQVPIRRLNMTIAAVVPDWVSVATHATLDDANPWLYTTSGPFPITVMNALVIAWLNSLQPSRGAYPLLQEAMQRLATSELAWDLTQVDLLECTVSGGGTALPARHLYRLLPDVLAGRIEQLPPYEYCGARVAFRRVATSISEGAELMSWPPFEHTTTAQGGGKRLWNYSATIKIALRTVPFSPVPHVYLSVGIRRWVRGPVCMPQGRGVSVYLLADSPFLQGAPIPSRFAMGKLKWDKNARKVVWAPDGPEQMLDRLSVTRNIPLPELLVKEPEAWLPGRDGVTAAVVHHAMMGLHGVGTGVMPSERRRVVEWAAQALEPHFKWSGELRRSVLPSRPRRTLEKRKPVRKDAQAEERAGIEAANQQAAQRNADRRRRHLAEAVGERGMTAYVLYQTEHMVRNLIAAAEASLNLAGYRLKTGPATWSWHAPELTVRLHAHPLGALGGQLGEDRAPRKGTELDAAISARRGQVRDYLARLSQDLSDPAHIAFVELDGRDKFKPRTVDPKFAIRLGCADAGLVSQFLRPGDPALDEGGDDARFRADAAWADGLRQVGMRFVPEHTLGDALPEQLNQVAFWLVKRRKDGPTGHPQFTPVAILIRPNQQCIMGRSPETADWVPYPELLKGLTRDPRDDQLVTAEQQEAAVAAFVKQILAKLRSEPTLVVTHAQNLRTRWPWLQNGRLVKDAIQFGNGPVQRLTTYGRHLRIARAATGERLETPEWWVPKHPGHGGLAKGLWLREDSQPDPRVFYSTIDKASTHPISVDATKLTPRPHPKKGQLGASAGKNAWNPDLLEFTMVGLQQGDDAEAWAMFLHQQRFSEDYRDGLGLPLILHLAALTSHYALPQEDVEKAETEPDAERE